MSAQVVFTSSAARSLAHVRRGWCYWDLLVLKAIADGPFHTVDQLAERLPYGVEYRAITIALDLLVADGFVEQTPRRLRVDGVPTLEKVIVHEITDAGRTLLLGDRAAYQKAA
jgi:hypothetical protein